MGTVERWWNGRWGRLARRDVYLRHDGTPWSVETREGGAEGRSKTRHFATEAEAREWLARCLDDQLGGWTRLDGNSRS